MKLTNPLKRPKTLNLTEEIEYMNSPISLKVIKYSFSWFTLDPKLLCNKVVKAVEQNSPTVLPIDLKMSL